MQSKTASQVPLHPEGPRAPFQSLKTSILFQPFKKAFEFFIAILSWKNKTITKHNHKCRLA